jgi:hypothetical protein
MKVHPSVMEEVLTQHVKDSLKVSVKIKFQLSSSNSSHKDLKRIELKYNVSSRETKEVE